MQAPGESLSSAPLDKNIPQSQSQRYAVITVTDTGPGLSKDQLALIGCQGVQFNPNELQGGGGSGLGLWISQQIIALHGGKLLITSPGLGLGASFQVELPLLRLEAAPRPSESRANIDSTTTGPFITPAASRYHPKRALLVDDTPSNRKMLGRILRTHNIPFDEAENGEECLAKVRATQVEATATHSPDSNPALLPPYDLILMDYEMPILNGPKATQRLRELGCSAIVIGVTGNVLPEDCELFKQHGADAVLPKPVKIHDLLELYHRLAAERAVA